MKGIMVTLLTMGLTGIVSGQQPQDNSNSFNSNPHGRPAVRKDDRGYQPVTPRNSSRSDGHPASGTNAHRSSHVTPSSQVGSLEMMLNDSILQRFKTQGNLTGAIEPLEAVNEIFFSFGGADGKRINNTSNNQDSVGVIKPVATRDRTLVFEMDDFDLDRIQKDGLRYRYEAAERGSYDQVVVLYKTPEGTPSTQQRDPASSDFASDHDPGHPSHTPYDRGLTDHGSLDGASHHDHDHHHDHAEPDRYRTETNPRRSPQLSDYTPSRSPDHIRGYDPGYLGPTRAQTAPRLDYDDGHNNDHDLGYSTYQPKRDLFRSEPRPPSSNRTPNRWAPEPNPGSKISNLLPRNDNHFSTRTDRERPSANLDRREDYAYSARSAYDRSPYSQRRAPSDPAETYRRDPYNRDYRDPGHTTENRLAPVAGRTQSPTNYDPSYESRLSPMEKKQKDLANQKAWLLAEKVRLQEAELLEIRRQNDLVQQARDRKIWETNYLADLQRSTTTVPQSQVDRDRFDRQQASLKDRSYNDYRSRDSGPPPSRITSDLVPNPSNLNNRGVRGLTTAVPGPNLSGNNIDNTRNGSATLELPIFFMLLCSIALNIYLSWISRGFYVRYNELADELRETFTASM